MKCDGCGRSILHYSPYKEYYIKNKDKTYCSQHCISLHAPYRDTELDIEFNYIAEGRIVSCHREPPDCHKCRDRTICFLPKKVKY